MNFTDIVGLVAALAAVAAVVVAAVAALNTRKTRSAVVEVHAIVNSRYSELLRRVEQLGIALSAAGLKIPESRESASGASREPLP